MSLYHVQDNDRQLYIIADSYGDAERKWESIIRKENEIDDDAGVDPPLGIQFLCDDNELVVDDKVVEDLLAKEKSRRETMSVEQKILDNFRKDSSFTCPDNSGKSCDACRSFFEIQRNERGECPDLLFGDFTIKLFLETKLKEKTE